MSSRQLTLDLPLRPAMGRSDFFVAPCNAAAVAMLDGWAEWPAGGLVLAGPEGAGKTHLAAVWRQETGAELLAADALPGADPVALAGRCRCWVVEDADRAVAGRAEREQGLFHLYNALRSVDGRLMLTARPPAARWPLGLPDLGSRVRALAAAQIGAPDDTLLAALLLKLFGDRQLRVSRPALDYMLRRVERSFAGVERVVAAVDAQALAAHREVTRELVREMFAAGRFEARDEAD